jgi:hypothetical protein
MSNDDIFQDNTFWMDADGVPIVRTQGDPIDPAWTEVDEPTWRTAQEALDYQASLHGRIE